MCKMITGSYIWIFHIGSNCVNHMFSDAASEQVIIDGTEVFH